MDKDKALMTIFLSALLLCGCSVESFFCGGAPIAILSAIVAVAVAVVLGSKGGGDGTD
jgi:hypothetical protein